MTQTRIYVVINKATGEKRLVEATSQSAAIRHCVAPNYRADVASPKTVASYMGEGLRVEVSAFKSEPVTQTTHTQGV